MEFFCFSDPTKDNNSEDKVTYICTLSPLFDIQLVHNLSYIVSLQFQRSPQPDQNSTAAFNESALFDSDISTDDEDSFVSVPVVVNELSLTLISESKMFHRGIFLFKCLFTPFVIGSLLLFCVRMYLNDLVIFDQTLTNNWMALSPYERS